MKQRTCVIILTALVCVVILASCRSYSDSNSTGSSTATVTTKTPVDVDSNEKAAEDFLESLKEKDVKRFVWFTNKWYNHAADENENTRAYSFIRDDVDVASYKIVSNETKEGFCRFTVELNISASDNDLFPIGTGEWFLDFDNFNYRISLFRETDKEINIITYNNQNDIVEFCRSFSFELDCYKSVTDFNTLIPDDDDELAGYFCQRLIRCLPIEFDNNGSSRVKRKELEKQAKSVLGITTLDVTKSKFYDKQSDSEIMELHAGSDSACSLVSDQVNPKTNQRVVVIDYYSDTAYILKAKTIQYTLRMNADKSFTLISTELLYDSGFQVASGLI